MSTIKLESIYAMPIIEDPHTRARAVRLSTIFTCTARSVYIDLPAGPMEVAEALKVLAMKIEALADKKEKQN